MHLVYFVSFQENLELSQDQQALVNYIVEAYNKHRIPQDMAKKLVCLLSFKNVYSAQVLGQSSQDGSRDFMEYRNLL